MRRVLRAVGAFVPAALWAALLLWVGSRSDVALPSSSLPLDKVAHFTGYGILGALVGFGWRRVSKSRLSALILLLCALGVGVLDEMNQRVIPGRSSDRADWVADALGASFGFILAARIFARPKSKTRKHEQRA